MHTTSCIGINQTTNLNSIGGGASNESVEIVGLRTSLERKVVGAQFKDGFSIALNDAFHGVARCNGDSKLR